MVTLRVLVSFFLFSVVFFGSSCSRLDQGEMALMFSESPNYEFISDQDKQVYSREEFDLLGFDVMYFQPEDRYFLLEKYLRGLSYWRLKSEGDGAVVVTKHSPSVLSEMWFYSGGLVGEGGFEKLENLYSVYLEGGLNSSDLMFGLEDIEYKFVDSGIFLDLSRFKSRQAVLGDIALIKGEISYITDDYLDLFFMSVPSGSVDEFGLLLEVSKKLEANIRRCESAKADILLLDEDADTARIDRYVSHALKVLAVRDSYLGLKSGIHFSDVRIAPSTSGGLSLFGSYKYLGRGEIKYSHFLAKFLDDSQVLVGVQLLKYFAGDLFYGKQASFGVGIEDQFVARMAKSVVFEPVAVF